MSTMNRRDAIKRLLGGLVQTAGAVVLAQATAPATAASEAPSVTDRSPEERADALAADMPIAEEETCANAAAAFRNAAFRNGGFRNAGFVNGGFRNAGFVNGGFRNAGFHNGGWRNF